MINLRILIIEDEYPLADAIQEILKRNNYAADIETNGEDGLNAALTNIYDLIILDLMLPQRDGLNILKELRKNHQTTPVIILTAKATTDDIIKGLDYGADDYLTKPFATKELLARIRAISRRKDKIIIDNLKYEDIELNKYNRELSCITTNKKIKLSEKEFLLLEYLINNQKIIITKEQILDKLWGKESLELEYNNAEVYVSFLRKKINFIGSNVKIKALRNYGYILEVNYDS